MAGIRQKAQPVIKMPMLPLVDKVLMFESTEKVMVVCSLTLESGRTLLLKCGVKYIMGCCLVDLPMALFVDCS